MRVAKLITLVTMAVFVGCLPSDRPGMESEQAATSAGTGSSVATWNGGQAQAEEVEQRLLEVPQRRGATAGMDAAARLDTFVERYRLASRALVVDSVLLDSMPDRNAALASLDLTEHYASVRIKALLQAYLQERADAIEITDDQLEAYYLAHSARFITPAAVTLWNIYRRHEDPDDPAATSELLRSLRERFLAGETFAALAREYSQSETRLRDGLVGQYRAADLPPRLADIVFALDELEISQPIPIKDGAVLLHVSEKTEGSQRSLDQARTRLENLLRRRALDDEVAARVRDLTPPDGSMVASIAELEEVLDGGDREQEVLVIGEFRATAGDFASFMAQATRPDALDPGDQSDEAVSQRRAHALGRLVERALLYGELVRTDDSALTADLRGEVEDQVTETRDRMIADEEIRRRVEKLADEDEVQLRNFHADNLHHFQSQLRFRLRRISTPLNNDSIGQMAALELLRERLIDGELTLEAAAAEIGGEVADLGWKEPSALTSNERTYLLELGGVGFAIPYVHEEQEIRLLQVEAREDPRPLAFAQARERVLEEYLHRNRRALAEQVTEQILAEAGYRFHAAAVRRHLAPPPS